MRTNRNSGFTLVELLVVIAIIAILIPSAQQATQGVRDAATTAAQFPSLAPVANQVLQTANIEGSMQNALFEANALFSDLAQQQQLPNSDQLDEISNVILPALQQGEIELQQEFFALPNPASLLNPGELEAYLGLKMSLVEAETKVNISEIEITKVADKSSAGR